MVRNKDLVPNTEKFNINSLSFLESRIRKAITVYKEVRFMIEQDTGTLGMIQNSRSIICYHVGCMTDESFQIKVSNILLL